MTTRADDAKKSEAEGHAVDRQSVPGSRIFSAEESEHLLVRANLLLQLQKTLVARELTQVQAARLLQVTQPRVSDLLRGRIDLFSTDCLIEMLARFGMRVRFVLKPAS
jgi:predicted XRE-type DNA-binding protein